jgi:hypothetical protein
MFLRSLADVAILVSLTSFPFKETTLLIAPERSGSDYYMTTTQ